MCICEIIHARVSMTRVSIFIITAIAYHQYMYKCTHTYLPPLLPVCVCMGKKINVTVSMTRVSMFMITAIAYNQYMYKCTHTYLPPFLPVCVC